MADHRKPTPREKSYRPPNFFNHKYSMLRRKISRPQWRAFSKGKQDLLHRVKHHVKMSFTLGVSSLSLLALMPPLQGQASIPFKSAKKRHEQMDNSDLWQQIAKDFTLDGYDDNPAVQQQIRWYQKHPKSLTEVTQQAAPYLYYVHQQVKEKGLPGELVLLPIIESAYDPFAYSHVGASGLWQLMPQTGSRFGLKQSSGFDGRRDVINSTQAALNYLNYLDNMFNDNWLLALAAYNSGPGTVLNADKRNRGDHSDSQFWSLHLPQATMQYVPRLLAIAAIVKDPNKYGIQLPNIPNRPYFAKVDVDDPIALSKVAKMSDMSVDDVYSLNPGYSHMQVTSSSPGHILIPVEKIDTFKQNMDAQGKTIDVQMPTLAENSSASNTSSDASNTAASNNNAVTYKVQAGDTLSKVALHNHIKLKDLLAWNHLTAKSVLRNGQSLQISAPDSVAVSDVASASSQDDSTHHGKRIDEIFYPVTPKTTVVQLGDKKEPTTTIPVATKEKSDSSTDNKTAQTTYRVKAGDTLSTIAKKQGVSVASLQKANHLKGSHLKIGQVLTISQMA